MNRAQAEVDRLTGTQAAAETSAPPEATETPPATEPPKSELGSGS